MTESVKNTTNNINHITCNMANKKQKGGFLLDLLFGKKVQPRQTQSKKVKTTLGVSKDSEDKLIKSYENLASVSKKYYEDYNKHLENLITLDDINGMTGLQSTFKNVIVKDLFKGYDKVDQSSPILLKNYSVTENTTPKFFRKEHLISQIRYKLSSFALKDTLLISQYDVSMEDNKANIKFKMINGDIHEKSVSIDNNFNMDLSKLQGDLREIIKNMKKKMDYEIEIADDFELTEADLEIPGLEFAAPETALERKIKALKPSVKVDSAELATTKPKASSIKKEAPAWEPLKQPQIEQLTTKEKDGQGQNKRRDNNRGRKPSFNGDKSPGRLDKGAADPEQQLQAQLAVQALEDAKPKLPQPANGQQQQQRPARDQWQQNKPREVVGRPVNPLQAKCEQFTSEEDCRKNKCYFAKNKKCYAPLGGK